METSTILTAIANNKEIQKNLSKMDYPLTNEQFLDSANDYIKAIKDKRMLCIIKSVSASGMSRNLKFHSYEENKGGNGGYYRQYSALFKALGFKESRSKDGSFTVNGFGMDMIFHTNYTNMHTFKNLGIITKEECEVLAQQTPTNL